MRGYKILNRKAFLRTYPFAYGGGMMLISATVATYFSIFMTDTFGIPAAAASVIMFIATLWDAINNPMMGMIADRTHNRFGRYRSYYLWVPVVLSFAVHGSILILYVWAGMLSVVFTIANLGTFLAPGITTISRIVMHAQTAASRFAFAGIVTGILACVSFV